MSECTMEKFLAVRNLLVDAQATIYVMELEREGAMIIDWQKAIEGQRAKAETFLRGRYPDMWS